MRKFDQKIVGIHNSVLAGAGEQPFRINGNVLVKRLILKNQIIHTLPAAAPGTSGLLPEGGPGSRISYDHRGIQFPDINSQFQSVG